MSTIATRTNITGEHDRAGAGLGAHDLRGLDAVQAGHANVEQDDVRIVFSNGGDRGGAVARLGHDFDVGLGVQDHREAAADEFLVVRQHHPDHAITAAAG
ncbi:hypothetical protein GCM10022254_58640 [Actinomadura meridiana]|uniref:Uncharacterized protein n=1 Tax=Actinomadura meridiana TaxID=559626 RepID=A0ABP8CH72_9ACTN